MRLWFDLYVNSYGQMKPRDAFLLTVSGKDSKLRVCRKQRHLLVNKKINIYTVYIAAKTVFGQKPPSDEASTTHSTDRFKLRAQIKACNSVCVCVCVFVC